MELPDCHDGFTVIDSTGTRSHERAWQLTSQSSFFCTQYQTYHALYEKAEEGRNNVVYQLEDYENFWGVVYQNLVNESRNQLSFIADSLQEISIERALSKPELAELLVTFIQDIPYSFVLGENCSEAETNGKKCIGNIPLGILSPYGFLHTLYGDCDTRAVLLFVILEELGFDPMIVISNEYAHAMLALNIPSTGEYLEHQGKNYYFWETTSKGWPIGMLPPSMNNVDYWKIALVHES